MYTAKQNKELSDPMLYPIRNIKVKSELEKVWDSDIKPLL